MKIPRWTVYPALGLIILLAVTAVPRRSEQPHSKGGAMRARAAELRENAAHGDHADPAAASINASTDVQTEDNVTDSVKRLQPRQ